jgi:cytochrome b involved in lipid metabolism
MVPQESFQYHTPPSDGKTLCCYAPTSVGAKKRLCAGWLGILVLGTLALGLVAFHVRHRESTLRPLHGPSSVITLSDLGQHDTPEDCWIVIYQAVYDVTEYAQHHPNPQFITLHCGRDVSALYESVHAVSMLKIIQRRQVGVFHHAQHMGGRNQTSETVADGDYHDAPLSDISIDEMLQHRSPLDCWMALYGDVYDVTEYAPFHPNPHFVTDYCGLEVTKLFSGAHDQSVVKVIRQRCMGRLSKKLSGGSPPPSPPADDSGSSPIINTTEESTSQRRPFNTTPAVTNPPSSVPIAVPAPVFVNVSDKLELLFGLENSTTP